MDPISIAVIGGINKDTIFSIERVPNAGESMDATTVAYSFGGKGANAAIAACRASRLKPQKDRQSNSDDIQIYMNGAVGADEDGLQMKQWLERNGVNTSTVRRIEGEASGTCSVWVEKNRGESRNVAFQGANLRWKPLEANSVSCFGGGKESDLIVLHLGIPAEVIEYVLAIAASRQVDTLLNPSPPIELKTESYKDLTHLLLNESEAASLSGEKIEQFNDPATWKRVGEHFSKLGVQNVVITLGAKGAFYKTPTESGWVEAQKDIAVVDTTGAGDTFVGTYAVEYVRGKRAKSWNIRKSIERACKAAAMTITRLGAQESIPWSDEI